MLMRTMGVPADPEAAETRYRMNLTQGGALVPVLITSGAE
jgi:hypothetical protein